MLKALTWAAALVLALHGLVQLMGTTVYMELGELEGMPYKTMLLDCRWDPGGSPCSRHSQSENAIPLVRDPPGMLTVMPSPYIYAVASASYRCPFMEVGMRRAAALAALMLLIGACETTPTGNPVVNAPSNQPVFLKAIDTHFRLSQEQRATVHPAYNADAVERLLSWIRPEVRSVVLESFSRSTVAGPDEKVALGEATWDVDHPQVREIVKDLRAPTRTPAATAEQTPP